MTNIDLHIHSCYSKNLFGTRILMPPSRSTPEDIIKVALKKNIKAIAITDHDSLIGSLKAMKLAKKYNMITLPAVEISTKEGHMLAYNVQEEIKKDLPAEETIERIKQQGGVAVPAHPLNKKYSLKKDTIMKLKKNIFAIEVYNSHSWTNNRVRPFAEKHGFSMIAGSDAHHLSEIGNAYGSTVENIDSAEDLLKSIKKKEIVPHLMRNASIVLDIIPNAIGSFTYWKLRQIQKVFKPEIIMPYDKHPQNQ